MPGQVIRLAGCTPEPLGSYLKGLGVFRLIAEQADALARCWWKDGVLWISTIWSSEEILDFFLIGIGDKKTPIYSPTPFFSPWGGRPGFYSGETRQDKADDELTKVQTRLAKIRQTNSPARFDAAKATVIAIEDQLKNGWLDLSKVPKVELIASMRNIFNERALNWFDACVAVEEKPSYGFLFGTGGNEGSADVTNNFWEMIDTVLGMTAPPSTNSPKEQAQTDECMRKSSELLSAALFGKPRIGGTKRTAGQHFPLGGGSANCGQAFFGYSSTNPWDLILMMEGGVLFSGAMTKRLSQMGKGKAAFPFMVDYLSTGEISTSTRDEASQDLKIEKCRAEFWMPLWSSPTSLLEIQTLLLEGRLQRRSGEPAEHTLHAIEAIRTLGSSRGIETFHRVGLFERRGKGSYLASSLGSYSTSRSSNAFAKQLSELDRFRQQLYHKLRGGIGVPDRIMRARERFQIALSELLQREEYIGASRQETLLGVLTAIASIEREVELTKGAKDLLKPCPSLTRSWLPYKRDSAEYNLALAVAQIGAWGDLSTNEKQQPQVDRIRTNLLSVSRNGSSWDWDERTQSAVWMRGAPLATNLVALLRRRLVDATRDYGNGLPLWSFYGASFQDLLAFWQGNIDEQRLSELIQALALISTKDEQHSIDRWQNRYEPTYSIGTLAASVNPDGAEDSCITTTPLASSELLTEEELRSAFQLPRIYHLLKLCFLGGRLPPRPTEINTTYRSGAEPFPPHCLDILLLLSARRISDAAQIAGRRLRARGYPNLLPTKYLRTLEMNTDECSRLAAMLVIPVRQPGVLASLSIKAEVPH